MREVGDSRVKKLEVCLGAVTRQMWTVNGYTVEDQSIPATWNLNYSMIVESKTTIRRFFRS